MDIAPHRSGERVPAQEAQRRAAYPRPMAALTDTKPSCGVSNICYGRRRRNNNTAKRRGLDKCHAAIRFSRRLRLQ